MKEDAKQSIILNTEVQFSKTATIGKIRFDCIYRRFLKFEFRAVNSHKMRLLCTSKFSTEKRELVVRNFSHAKKLRNPLCILKKSSDC